MNKVKLQNMKRLSFIIACLFLYALTIQAGPIDKAQAQQQAQQFFAQKGKTLKKSSKLSRLRAKERPPKVMPITMWSIPKGTKVLSLFRATPHCLRFWAIPITRISPIWPTHPRISPRGLGIIPR